MLSWERDLASGAAPFPELGELLLEPLSALSDIARVQRQLILHLTCLSIILHIILCFLHKREKALIRPGKSALREIVGVSRLVGALWVARGPH